MFINALKQALSLTSLDVNNGGMPFNNLYYVIIQKTMSARKSEEGVMIKGC